MWHVHMPPLAYAAPAIYTHISLPISSPKVLILSSLSHSLALRIWKKNTVYGTKTTSPHHHIFILRPHTATCDFELWTWILNFRGFPGVTSVTGMSDVTWHNMSLFFGVCQMVAWCVMHMWCVMCDAYVMHDAYVMCDAYAPGSTRDFLGIPRLCFVPLSPCRLDPQKVPHPLKVTRLAPETISRFFHGNSARKLHWLSSFQEGRKRWPPIICSSQESSKTQPIWSTVNLRKWGPKIRAGQSGKEYVFLLYVFYLYPDLYD